MRLEKHRCQQGCPGEMLMVAVNDSWGMSLNGCGGPYGPGREVSPRELTARQRQRLQDLLAREMANGRVDREEGEAFLDYVFGGFSQ